MIRIIEITILVSLSFGVGLSLAAHLVRCQAERVSYIRVSVYARMRVVNETLAIAAAFAYFIAIIASAVRLPSIWRVATLTVAALCVAVYAHLSFRALRVWRDRWPHVDDSAS